MNQPNFQPLAPCPNLASQLLESVSIEGHLHDLACELSVKQIFLNPSQSPIEAVYTFPLPHAAVLLNLEATIGERELRGSVVPKKQAERRYEKAIADGDGAIMLEKSDDGICTINLGNLLPGERATLRYQYAYLLTWQQDTVKFRLPNTIAPRYGDPIAAGYQPHQVPVCSMITENAFSLKLTIAGLLAKALVDSPSHPIIVNRKGNATDVSLCNAQAFMDRDFVLDMRLNEVNQAAGQMAWDEVSQCYAVLASFFPQIPGMDLPRLCVKIVVDCSGSMSGDSILQAQAGLRRILDNLRETDTFNIIRFGNQHSAFFPHCVEASGRNLRYARRAIDQIVADMGGTEMAAALDFTYALGSDVSFPAAVLLITDGEINAHHDVIKRAESSGQRIFTVGVGAAVAEEFVRGIADRTGGACELVTPNENMAEAIYRQFRRMFQSHVVEAVIDWPGNPLWQTPKPIGPIFSGDTVHVFAGLTNRAEGYAKLNMRLDNGQEISQTLDLTSTHEAWLALPRLAASQRIECLDQEQQALAEELANDYQLLTEHTNFLILDRRDEQDKTDDFPQLVQVPQMLAAGWGGTGTIRSKRAKDQFSTKMGGSNRVYQSPDDADSLIQYKTNTYLSEIEMEMSKSPMSMAYAACEQSHPSSSLPTFSKTTAPLSLDEIETLFNNAPDSGSVFMEAISMSNDPFIGAPKISITLDSTEAFVFQEFDSAIHHDEEKFTYTGPNKEMLLNSILVAGKQWLTVFLDEVLPSLDVSLHKTFQELVSQEGWSEAQVAATILLLIAKQVGNDRITRAFDKLLEPVSKPQELADYIEVALLLKDDATELKTFLIQTKRELA